MENGRQNVRMIQPYTPKKGNSLAEKKPQVSKDWDYEKNAGVTPETVSAGSDYYAHWKCHVCGYEWEQMVKKRNDKHYICPDCKKKKRAQREYKKGIDYVNTKAPRTSAEAILMPDISDVYEKDENGSDNRHRYVIYRLSTNFNNWMPIAVAKSRGVAARIVYSLACSDLLDNIGSDDVKEKNITERKYEDLLLEKERVMRDYIKRIGKLMEAQEDIEEVIETAEKISSMEMNSITETLFDEEMEIEAYGGIYNYIRDMLHEQDNSSIKEYKVDHPYMLPPIAEEEYYKVVKVKLRNDDIFYFENRALPKKKFRKRL